MNLHVNSNVGGELLHSSKDFQGHSLVQTSNYDIRLTKGYLIYTSSQSSLLKSPNKKLHQTLKRLFNLGQLILMPII